VERAASNILRTPDWVEGNDETRVVHQLLWVKEKFSVTVKLEDIFPGVGERTGSVEGGGDNGGEVVVENCVETHRDLAGSEIEYQGRQGRVDLRKPEKHAEACARMPARNTLAIGEVVVQNIHRATKLVGAREFVVRLAVSSGPDFIWAHSTVETRQTVEDPDGVVNCKRPQTGVDVATAGPVAGKVEKVCPSPTDHCTNIAFCHTILKLGVGSAKIVNLRLTCAVRAKLGRCECPVVGVVLVDRDAVKAGRRLESVLTLESLRGLLRELREVEDFPTGVVDEQGTAGISSRLFPVRIGETADR